jgi:hypothetical protein
MIMLLTLLFICLFFFGLGDVGIFHWEEDLVPEGLLKHCEGLRSTFPKIGTKFGAHLLSLSLIHCENLNRSSTRPQINACVTCPRPPSYMQLGTLTHMLVIPSTGASRYHNCCIDDGTSPEYSS